MKQRRAVAHRAGPGSVEDFVEYLRSEERGESTIQKYARYVREFLNWADGAPVTKAAAVEWKESLQESGEITPATVNAKLAAINAFFRFAGWDECRVKALRLQRSVFRDPEKDLTREEYQRLVATARRRGKERLALIMETICGTGIRVSELRYVSVEAVESGRAVVNLKGKIRTILLPGKLRKKLKRYAGKNKIASGEIFLTRSGKGLSRCQVWSEMKAVCREAGVEPAKVFPHNLRHLFAKTYYRVYRDIVKLADILGHSSIATTRIYLLSSGTEHAQQLERLKLVC